MFSLFFCFLTHSYTSLPLLSPLGSPYSPLRPYQEWVAWIMIMSEIPILITCFFSFVTPEFAGTKSFHMAILFEVRLILLVLLPGPLTRPQFPLISPLFPPTFTFRHFLYSFPSLVPHLPF